MDLTPDREPIPNDEKYYWAAYTRGEQAGFDYVFKKFYGRMLYFALKVLYEKKANKVAGDAFVKAWDVRRQFKEPEDLKFFLYSFVQQGCHDILKDPAKELTQTDVIECEIFMDLNESAKKKPENKLRKT
jgi:DNA-directed RNA polymerase specialized sigma24 family protein